MSRKHKKAFAKIKTVCMEAAKGNFEARIIDIGKPGDIADTLNAINRLLDLTDAFIREAGASLDYASKGKFFRRFLLRGMLGDFRRGAQTINSAREAMEAQTNANTHRLGIAEKFGASVTALAESVSQATSHMESTAADMSRLADKTHEQSLAVAAAAEQATVSVQTVAATTDEMSRAVEEISAQVMESASTTQNAVTEMKTVDDAVNNLRSAADQIEKVLDLIRDIAGQTNLLALNATIEAARAGEAGRGFSIVASEVKTLAQESAQATDNINAEITGIQSASKQTEAATKGIGANIDTISEIAAAIASAIEEQTAATREISGNARQVAEGTAEVTAKITEISGASEETGQAAKEVLDSASALSRQAADLSTEVERFLEDFRAA